jgi:hypothetical protein
LWIVLAVISLALLAPRSGRAATIRLYVDVDAAGANNGSTWTDAYTSLQDALAVANTLVPTDTVEVWVATGVYYPDVGAGLTDNDTNLSFTLNGSVAVYGGFLSGQSALTDRDWQTNLTVLSGDIEQNDTVDAHHITLQVSDQVGANSSSVVAIPQDQATAATLDGVVATGGNGFTGGGIRVANRTYPFTQIHSLANLRLQGNRANYGGGLFTGLGVAVTARNVQFINNSAVQQGGGYFSYGGATPNVNGAVFQGNVAGDDGGAYYCVNCYSIRFYNMLVQGNSAGDQGGGFYVDNDSATIANVVFSGNRAGNVGGAMSFRSAWPWIVNVTMVGNHAVGAGGGVYVGEDWGDVNIGNNIIWGNSDSTGTGTAGASVTAINDGKVHFTNSLAQGRNPGGANLDGTDVANTPLFVANPGTPPSTVGDLHVTNTSLIVDKGYSDMRLTWDNTTETIRLIPIDVDGNSRFVSADNGCTTTIDLGAYEVQTQSGMIAPCGNTGTGPGGVGTTDGSSNLRLWLKPDQVYGAVDGSNKCSGPALSADGAAVVCWQDASGYHNDAYHLTSGPTRETDAPSLRNGQPVLRFNGAQSLNVGEASPVFNGDGVTVFFPFSAIADFSDGAFLDRRSISSGTYGYAIYGQLSFWSTLVFPATANVATTGWTVGEWNVARAAYAYSLRVYRNGVSLGSTPASQMTQGGSNNFLVIGRNQVSNNYINADLPEMIAYTQQLADVDAILVENYLAAKYNTPTANDVYNGDTPANGDFDLDVAGIGQYGGAQHPQSHAAGLIVRNRTFLRTDGDWLLFGHNTPVNQNTTADLPTTGDWATAPNPVRWLRAFDIHVTDVLTDGGKVDLVFDLSEGGLGAPLPGGPLSNYRLLKRSTATGPFTDVTAAAGATVAVSGDQIQFLNVDVSVLGSNFTVGTLNRIDSPTAVHLGQLTARSDSSATGWLMGAVALALVTVVLRRKIKAASTP